MTIASMISLLMLSGQNPTCKTRYDDGRCIHDDPDSQESLWEAAPHPPPPPPCLCLSLKVA